MPSERPSAPPALRLPCLDGLRALSIGLVIAAHLGHAVPALDVSFVELGNLGVRVFFVISGFLITTLLCDEEQRHGRVSLAQFYLRRTFRIFPAFYAFIGAMVLAAGAGLIVLPERDLVAAATYTMNYHSTRVWQVGHLWSLAVEEQFYLLWPLTFVLLGGARRHLRRWAVLAAVLIPPLVRVATVKLWPAQLPSVGESFQTVADTLAVGCGLALVRDDLPGPIVKLQQHALAPLAYAAIAVTGHAFHDHIRWSYSLGETLVNASIALAIDSLVRQPSGRLGRLLERPSLVWIGQLSYSLYLWQQPFLLPQGASVATRPPLSLVVLVGCAVASHYLIERPMLRLRRHFEHRRREAPAH